VSCQSILNLVAGSRHVGFLGFREEELAIVAPSPSEDGASNQGGRGRDGMSPSPLFGARPGSPLPPDHARSKSPLNFAGAGGVSPNGSLDGRSLSPPTLPVRSPLPIRSPSPVRATGRFSPGGLVGTPTKPGAGTGTPPHPKVRKVARTDILGSFIPITMLEKNKNKSMAWTPGQFLAMKRERDAQVKLDASAGAAGGRRKGRTNLQEGKFLHQQELLPFTKCDDKDIEWSVVQLDLPKGFQYEHAEHISYFVYMVRVRNLSANTSAIDFDCFHESVKMLGEALSIIWAKEMRRRERKLLVKDMESSLYEWRELPVQELAFKAIMLAESVLPGASIYVGLNQEGGDAIQYVAASPNSRMSGKRLPRGQGVSFEVMEKLETLIMSDKDSDKSSALQEGSLVEVASLPLSLSFSFSLPHARILILTLSLALISNYHLSTTTISGGIWEAAVQSVDH